MSHEVDMFSEVPETEQRWLARALKNETVGGLLLMASALFALVWANSAWSDSYEAIVNFKVGPEALNLNLTLNVWAADLLLAIFFFVIGCELKH